jgi:hypothetical protein
MTRFSSAALTSSPFGAPEFVPHLRELEKGESVRRKSPKMHQGRQSLPAFCSRSTPQDRRDSNAPSGQCEYRESRPLE